jgi:hypothetical protein
MSRHREYPKYGGLERNFKGRRPVESNKCERCGHPQENHVPKCFGISRITRDHCPCDMFVRPAVDAGRVDKTRMYRMVCNKCGSRIATNELSHRKRHCSCIGCDGVLEYPTDEDWQKAEAVIEYYADPERYPNSVTPNGAKVISATAREYRAKYPNKEQVK